MLNLKTWSAPRIELVEPKSGSTLPRPNNTPTTRPLLKPSPERQGLRGTHEWWDTTIRTVLGTAAVGALVFTVAWNWAGGVTGEPTKKVDNKESGCVTPEQHRANGVIMGRVAASQDVVCGQPQLPYASR